MKHSAASSNLSFPFLPWLGSIAPRAEVSAQDLRREPVPFLTSVLIGQYFRSQVWIEVLCPPVAGGGLGRSVYLADSINRGSLYYLA